MNIAKTTAIGTYIEPPELEPTPEEEVTAVSGYQPGTFEQTIMDYLTSLRKPLTDLGIEPTYRLPSPMDVLKTPRLKMHQGGTHYVSETGSAIVHRGETISPAGRDIGGDVFNFNISVNAAVSSDYDVERIAEQLGAAMQTQLSDKRGKSKYRMR